MPITVQRTAIVNAARAASNSLVPIGRPIVAIASAAPRRRLLAVFPRTIVCDTWAAVEATLERAEQAILFVDPMAADDCIEQVVRVRERFASLVIVTYTVWQPAALHQVVALAQLGIGRLVICGHDDTPKRLRGLVEESDYCTDSTLKAVEPQLERLSGALRRAVCDMFRQPRRFRSTLDLAAAAGMSARATFRHLKAAGFVSPRRLVASARVLRACELLKDRDRTATEVAARLGYRSADQLTRHLAESVGCTASDIKRGDGPKDPSLILASLAISTAPSRRVSPELVFED